MIIFKNIKLEQGLWIGFTALVFLYIVIRAVYNPLSHDEVATYFHYLQSGEYLPPQKGIIWDANNHLLNSFLSEISYHLFGNSHLALRLPNVLSFLLYAFFVAQLIKRIKDVWVRSFGFIALLSVAYLVEYFALCRGYGMSMALFLGALLHSISFAQTSKIRHQFFALLLILLSCLANLTLINTYGLMLVYFLVFWLVNKSHFGIKKSLVYFSILLFSIISMLYPIYYSLQLKASGALYYGSKISLWEVTGKTLSDQVFGSTSKVFAILYLLLILGAIFLFVRNRVGLIEKLKTPFFLLVYFIVGNIFAIYFLVFFLDVNFPEDRAAFYFIPLFLLLFLFVLDEFKPLKYLSFLLLFFPIYLLSSLNIEGSIFSADERVSKIIQEKIARQNMESPTIGAYQTHILCYNYLEQRKNRPTNFAQPYKENDTLQDFLINKRALIDSAKVFPIYNLVYKNEVTDVCLLQRKERLHFKEQEARLFPDSTSSYEYINLVLDTLEGQNAIKINLDLTLETKNNYFKGNLVFSGRDSLDNEIEYQYINLDWLYGNQTNKRQINQNFVVNTTDMDHYVLYLWNIDRQKVSFENTKLHFSCLN